MGRIVDFGSKAPEGDGKHKTCQVLWYKSAHNQSPLVGHVGSLWEPRHLDKDKDKDKTSDSYRFGVILDGVIKFCPEPF